MRNRNLAFLLAFLAATIYGVSFTVAKDVMPEYIKPYGFILMRVSGATVLFWAISLTVMHEKIDFKDFKNIILAAFFGVALNMLTFFKGLSLTTPINGAVIMITTPILVLIFSFIFLQDKVTWLKILGVILGLVGAVMLIRFGKKVQVNAPNVHLGNFLVFINAASYGMYLIVVKPILKKYHPFHAVKWIYLFGLLMVLPFGIAQALDVGWTDLPRTVALKIGFIVVFTTFFTYLFNIVALRNLKPTTLSVFIYLQPLIASIYAIAMQSDHLDSLKIVSALLIFTGVYLVSYRTKKKTN
ncbi:MAG: EamA family transporter [Flavobacteriales bacterium]|nr:MAG: EamA family transporter [Flavobacteriales bacterium]